jgi:hypothetical protein
MERPREREEGLGIRRGRCGVADGRDKPKGRKDGTDRSTGPVGPDRARKMACGDLFWPMRGCGTWCWPIGECHVRGVTPWSCRTPRRVRSVNMSEHCDPGELRTDVLDNQNGLFLAKKIYYYH